MQYHGKPDGPLAPGPTPANEACVDITIRVVVGYIVDVLLANVRRGAELFCCTYMAQMFSNCAKTAPIIFEEVVLSGV